MRVETVQYENANLRVVQWARWGGVALLFYTAGLALDNFDVYTSEDGGFWVLLWLMLPYVALASVLLFSQARLDPPGYAPLLVAGVVAAASLALALRILIVEDPIMGPIVEPGVWSAVEVLANVGLPLAVLLFFLTAPYQAGRRVPPLLAIGIGVAVTAGAWAVSVRDLSDLSLAGTWVTIDRLLPSNAFGFLLIVAGAFALDSSKARTVALILTGVLAADAGAMVMNWATSEFTLSGWLLATNLAIRGSYILAVLAFGGLLLRNAGFAAASLCLVVALAAAVGNTIELEAEASNWLWFASFGPVTVVAALLLALVTIEIREQAADDPTDGVPAFREADA